VSLRVRGLSFGYGAKRVVDDLSFEVSAGEVVGLVGPNGAGKSTVIKLLTKVLKAQAGEVEVDGKDFREVSRLELARKLAVVPQLSDLPEAFSAFEIVMMGRTPHLGFFSAETEDDFERVEAAMRRTETWQFKDRSVSELSGGERQRVLLARALAQEPKYLLLDEPTNHLDLRYQIEVLRFTRCEVSRGLGALVVLHDLNLAARICERLIVMHRGCLVAEGEPAQVLSENLIREVYGAEVDLFVQPSSNFPVIMPSV